MKAVIPAAGLGTRFLPATKAQPKEMLPIVDKPAIQYAVEEVIASGIRELLIITGKDKRSIEDHFDPSMSIDPKKLDESTTRMQGQLNGISERSQIYYKRQAVPRGLGDAIYQARAFVSHNAFAVLLADDIIINPVPSTRLLMEAYKKYKTPIIGVERLPKEKLHRYGVIQPEQVGEGIYRIEDIVEKPEPGEAPSDLAVVGRYILTPDIMEILEHTKPGKKGEVQLTDALREQLKETEMHAVLIQGRRYDIGNKLNWLKATVEMALVRKDLGPEFREYLKQLPQVQLPKEE